METRTRLALLRLWLQPARRRLAHHGFKAYRVLPWRGRGSRAGSLPRSSQRAWPHPLALNTFGMSQPWEGETG